MRNSGKCDTIVVQIIIQDVNTRAFHCLWCGPLAFCVVLDTLVKKMLNYSSRRARDVVTQTDHLWYKVRLKGIICLALAR